MAYSMMIFNRDSRRLWSPPAALSCFLPSSRRTWPPHSWTAR